MKVTRRHMLKQGAAAGTAIVASALGPDGAEAAPAASEPFPIGLNTSTLRAQKLPIVEVVDIAAKAGYQAIEVWVDELERHVKSGGTLKDLNKRIRDHGLAVTGAIAFYEWMVDDDARRATGFAKAKRYMAQLGEIGTTHLAAPPCGDVKNVDLLRAAERYRELIEMGQAFNVVPAIEIWGPAKNLHRLGQAVLVALEAHHPSACILPDVYHLYKGGSGLSDIGKLNPNLLAGFHLNDYPADPPREKIADRHRVYPGDGIAPLARLIRDLRSIGYHGPLSIELFNPTYARQDPLVVATTALAKTRAVIRAALATSSG